jgi:hypothetical protein
MTALFEAALVLTFISPTSEESRTRLHGTNMGGAEREAQAIDPSTFAVAYHLPNV